MADIDVTGTVNKFMNPVTDFTTGIPGRRTTLEGRQTGQESDYLSRFRNAIMGQEAVPHMMTRIGNELNLPNLATNYTNVANQMTNLPETYGAATRGFDVNANQLNRIVSTKQAALAPALQTAQTGYQTALDERDRLIGATQAEQAKQLAPFQTEQDFLKDRWARETSGFNTDNEMQLNALIEKAKSGVTLTAQEWDMANKLAIAEKEYKARVETAGGSQWAPIPGTSAGLYNTQTGARKGWG